MEKELAEKPKQNQGLDEDQAMAAFAQHLVDEDLEDPAKILAEKKK